MRCRLLVTFLVGLLGSFGCSLFQGEPPCSNNRNCLFPTVCVAGVCRVGDPVDGGRLPDGGEDVRRDGGLVDGGLVDGGAVDGGPGDFDAGLVDGGAVDGGEMDGGAVDGGAFDAGTPDSGVTPAWFDDDWSNRVHLVLYNGEVEGVQNFPALLRLSDDVDFSAAQNDGADLRFVDADGEQVPFEIVSANLASNDTDFLEAWFLLGDVPAESTQAEVWLYWGNPAANDAQDARLLWTTAGYAAVFHLDGDPDGGSGPVDATGQVMATNLGSPWLRPGGGRSGKAWNFDANDGIDVLNLDDMDFPSTEEGSVELIVNSGLTTGGALFDLRSASRDHFSLYLADDGADVEVVAQAQQGSPTQESAAIALVIEPNNWRHLILSWKLDIDQQTVRLYRGNAASDLLNLSSFESGWRPREQTVTFASKDYIGAIDEIRLGRVFRTESWAELANSNTRNEVLVVGSEPPAPEPTFVGPAPDALSNAEVIWNFNEGSGTIINDSSEKFPPLDLAIADPSGVEWIEGALRVRAAVPIFTSSPPARLISTCLQGEGLSIEAWVQPANLFQVGPARIVTLSESGNLRAFSLGQAAAANYSLRLRTSASDANGTSLLTGTAPETLAAGIVELALTHIVASWSAIDGETTFTINGTVDSPATIWPGSLQPADGTPVWNLSNQLGIANEVGGNRGFNGAYYSVAIWCRPLLLQEVEQLYAAGPR